MDDECPSCDTLDRRIDELERERGEPEQMNVTLAGVVREWHVRAARAEAELADLERALDGDEYVQRMRKAEAAIRDRKCHRCDHRECPLCRFAPDDQTQAEAAATASHDPYPDAEPAAAHHVDAHHFEVTVTSWLHGADWRDGLLPQEIRASSLSEALHKAAELPLSAWFGEDYLDPEVPE